MEYEHLVSEAEKNHVAIVGRHDLGSTHPDVPAHLLEITRVDLGADTGREGGQRERATRTGADADREAQAVAVSQFLAD